jgi:hypothetical protein
MNGETESEKAILGRRKKKDNKVGKREVDKSKQKIEHGRNAKTEKERELHQAGELETQKSTPESCSFTIFFFLLRKQREHENEKVTVLKVGVLSTKFKLLETIVLA